MIASFECLSFINCASLGRKKVFCLVLTVVCLIHVHNILLWYKFILSYFELLSWVKQNGHVMEVEVGYYGQIGTKGIWMKL